MADDPTTRPTPQDDERTATMGTDEARETRAETRPGDTTEPTTAGDVQPAPVRRRRVGWHDTDVTSLVFGLLFLGIAAVWLLVQQDVVSWPDASRIFPVVLVAAGVIGLVGSLTRNRRSRRDEQVHPPA